MKYFLDTAKYDNLHNILCISGGGVKGYAEIIAMKSLEEEAIHSFGKTRLWEMYDLIGGSSVGAINAAMIALGKYSIEEIEAFYITMIKKIFTKRSTVFKPFPLYDAKVFKTEFIKLFGNPKFKDVKTKLLITSVNRITDTTEYFKSWEEGPFSSPEDDLVDIIMRSFAAPVYFGQINDDKHQAIWTDGGMGFYNLPIYPLKNEAEVAGWYSGNRNTMMHIIGGLYVDDGSTAREYKDDKNDRMLKQLFGGFIKPGSGGVARAGSGEDQMKELKFVAKRINNLHFRYWDYAIPKKNDKLDGSSNEDLGVYKLAGLKMMDTPLEEII